MSSDTFHVGFTGSRSGVLRREWITRLNTTLALYPTLRGKKVTFHHGDCIGCDALAHDIAVAAGCKIVIHPGRDINSRFRACCHTRQDHYGHKITVMPVRDYLKRNRDIVDIAQLLVGVPKDPDNEVLRSGTWSTIRYARQCDKSVVLL